MAFSMVPAAMWPSVAKIVDENRLGTAYGLMFSIQNIGLWLFPLLIGWVLDQSNPKVAALIAQGPEAVKAAKAAGENVTLDYTNPLLMLAALGIAGLIFSFALKAADKTSGFGLEQPNKIEAKS
jgi:MFS family permease